jgi:hypothetical protein
VVAAIRLTRAITRTSPVDRRYDRRMEKLNREQRRAAKFGRHQAPTSQPNANPWPETSPNPVFGGSDAPDDATAGRPDQDQTTATGAGTGGATEQSDRAPRREGARAGNSTKG